MATLRDLQNRFRKSPSAIMKIGDEVLVVDARARKTPCNFVEDKFRAALSSSRVPRRTSK
jgi:hypothetical protein